MKPQNIYVAIMVSIFLVSSAFAQNALAKEASKVSGNKTLAAEHNAVKHKVVIQVSDNDPKKWNLALNNAKNVQEDYGKDKVLVEIVAYGPGIPMIKMDSEAGVRISEAISSGVKVVACENTMRNTKLTKDDMLPNLEYVKSGVPYLMDKQQEGYSYIRP